MQKYQLFSNMFPPTHLSLARQTDSSASKLTLLVVLITVVLNQIKSLLLSHHHSTSALVSEILTSVLQTVQKTKQFTYGQYIFTEDNVQNTHTYTQYTQCTIKTYLVTNTHYTPYVHVYA